MSKEIDEKVVEMRFDNKQFEENVSTSISSLDKLKKALQLKDAGKAFQDIDSQAKKVDFSGLENAVHSVSLKFSALQVAAVSAIDHITRKAIDAGINLVKSLSVDQITAGWDKYNSKMNSVQTVMSATKETWEKDAEAMGYTGDQMGYVNQQLDKLQWFTDETSYSYTDMVSNIGKFTSAGRDLSESVSAMQGISTWAANAGASVTEAGRAMYNLSQSMGMGHVQLMDWKSIENANMATMEFKKAALEAGVAMGTLRKVSDGVYRSVAKGNTVTAETFRETLSDKWFTSDVLINVLNRYGTFSDKLHGFYEETGLETNKILEYIDNYAQALEENTEDSAKTMESIISEISEETEVSAESIKQTLDELGSAEMKLGRESFKAAQEVRTFKDAIGYTKDAVSSGWMKTFELIFGDYLEAKKLWTELSDFFYEVFVAGGEARNEVLKTWSEIGGRADLIQALRTALASILDIINAVKDGFYDFFPADTEMRAKKLFVLTEALKNFMEKIKMSEESLDKLKRGFKGVFAIADIVRQVFSAIFKVLKPAGSLLNVIGKGFLNAFAGLGDWLTGLNEWIKKSATLQEVISLTSNFIKSSIEGLSSFLKKSFQFFSNFGSGVKKLLEGIKNVSSQLSDSFKKSLTPLSETIKNFISENGVVSLGNMIRKIVKTAFKTGGFMALITTIIKTINKFSNTITGTIDDFKDKAKSFSDIKNALHGALESIPKYFEDMKKRIDPKQLIMIAGSIALLTFSLVMLSNIDPVKLGVALGTLTTELLELIGAFKLLTMIDGSGLNVKTTIAMLIGISVSMLILAKALKTLSGLTSDETIQGVIALGVIAGILVSSIAILSNIDVGSSSKFIATAFSMILIAGAIKMLAGSVKQLGDLDTGSLIKGVAAIGIIMIEMIAFTAATGGTAGVLAASAGMILLAVAIKIMASAMSDIAGLSWEGIGKALTAFAGILLIMTGILYLLSFIAPLAILGAGAVLVMSFALKVIASAMTDLSSLSSDELERLGTAVEILGKVLSKLAWTIGLLGVLSPNAKSGAAAMVIMTFALKSIVDTLKSLSDIRSSNLEETVDIFGKIISKLAWTIGLLGTFAKQALIGATVMVILAFALDKMSGGLKVILEAITDSVAKLASVGDPKLISKTMRTLILSVAALGLAIKSFDKTAGHRYDNLQKAADALITLIKPITSFSKLKHSDMRKTFTDIAFGIAKLGLGIKAFGPLSKIGAEAFSKVSKALESLSPILKSFSYNIKKKEIIEAFDAIFYGVYSIGLALKKYNFFSKYGADAFPKIADAIVNLTEPLIKLSDSKVVQPGNLTRTLDAIGKALMDFGKALKETPFWGSSMRAQGLTSVIGHIGEFKDGIVSLSKINTNVLGSTLTKVGQALKDIGAAIKETPFWEAEERGEALSGVISSIESFADGIKKFVDMKIELSAATNKMTAVKEFYANNFVSNIGNKPSDGLTEMFDSVAYGLGVLGGALKEAPVFNVTDKGAGVAEVANSLSAFAKGVKDFSDIGLDATGISSLMVSLGSALTTIGQSIADIKIIDANFFAAKAGGLSAVMSSFYDFGNAVKTLINLTRGNTKAFDSVDDLCEFIKNLGKAMADFGNALNTTDFGWGVDSKADGIVKIMENVEKIATVVKSFADIITSDAVDIQTVSDILTDIGKFISTIGTVLADVGIWGLLASPGIKATGEAIVNIISTLDSFTGIIDACKQMDEESGSFRTTDFNAIVGTIGTFISLIGAELNKFSFFGIGVKAKADAIVNVVNTIDTITKAMVAMENKKINANFISDRLDAITTGLGNFISLTDDIWLVLGDSAKIDLLVRASGAIKTVSEAIASLQTIPSATQAGISTESITAQGIAVKNYISGFITALKEFDGVNIDTETFTACVTAVSEVGPALSGIATINTAKVRNVLKDAASALTSFVDDTKGSVVLLEKFSVAGKNAATNFTTSFSEAIQAAYTEYQTAGDSIILQVAEGMKEQAATSKVKTISAACVSAIREYRHQFYLAGTYVALGYAEGIASGKPDAIKAARELVVASKNSLNITAEVSSPSKLFYRSGNYCVTGYVNSFYDGLKDSELAGKALATNSIMGAQYALRQIKSISESDLEINPRIRPVLDLSDVRAGAGLLSGYFGAAESLSVGTSVRLSSINSSLRNQNGSSSGIMKTDNSDIVTELKSLRSDMNAVTDKLEGMQIAINGKKAIAYLTKEMDRSLGRVESRRKRGV